MSRTDRRCISHLNHQSVNLIALISVFTLITGCANKHSYRLLTENDSYHPVERPDANYTSGLSLIAIPAKKYHKGDNTLVDKLNALQWKNEWERIPISLDYGIGQVFYTPDDVAIATLDGIDRNGRVLSLDRPYAGFLFLHGSIHNHYGRDYDWTTDMRRSLSARVGLTGNGSLAEELHTAVHESRDLTIPKGWGLQVGQMIGVTLGLEQRNRVLAFIGKTMGADVTTNVKASLGNVYTGLDAGVTLRMGWNLPRGYHQTSIVEHMVVPRDIQPELPPPELEEGETEAAPAPTQTPIDGTLFVSKKKRKTSQWHLYGFISHQNRWVFRDFALEGRPFRTEPHTVNREQIVNEFQYGFQLKFKQNWGFQALFAQRSKQFQNQRKEHSFGQFLLMYDRPIDM